MADMKVAIEFPAGSKRPVGLLLDTAEAAPAVEGLRWINGVRWVPWGCDGVLAQAANNCVYTQDLDPEDYAASVEQLAFNVYDSLNCSTLSDPAADITRRLSGRLDVMESAAFGAELISGAAGGGLSFSSEATQVFATPSGVLDALANLEGALAETLHGGQGMIHISPELLNYASSRFRYDNGKYYTATGHVVVSDAGYVDALAPEGQAASSSVQDWMYASGPVYVYKSSPTYRGLPGERIDYIHNRIDVFIEDYGLLIFEPCAVAAALATYSLD